MSRKFLSPIKLAQGASLPATGSAGELFFNTTDLKVYSHDGTTWNSVGGGAIPSDTAPSNPTAGMLWWKTNEGTLWTYYYDGDSYQWVEATNVIANVEPNPIPAGAIMAWGSDTIPANWLLCDGSAISRSTYASLFAAIGTQYGAGDGVTTFNLPNLKGKTVVGKDASQTEFDVLGETGGAKTHTLTTAEMPSHTHTQDVHSHTYSGTTSTAGNHNHAIYVDSTQLRYINTSASQSSGMGGLAGISGGADNLRTGTNGDHTHTYSGTTSSVAATNQNTGGGGAHNNLQPYIVLNYIIKFSAGETPGDSQLAVRVGAIETTTVRSVSLGGTGTSTLTSGGYLKGSGTSAITSQVGIPAGDITSGALGVAYGGTGNTVGAGLNPVVPSSLVVSGGSASASSTGRVSFTNITNLGLRDVFTSSSYTNFHVVLTISGVSAAVGDFYLRLGNSGTAETTVNYQYQAMRGYASTVAATGGSTSAIWAGQAWAIDANSDRPAHGTYTIGNPNQNKRTAFTGNVGYDNGYNIVTHTLFGTHNISTSYSDLFIYPSGNSFSGNIQVFGYR